MGQIRSNRKLESFDTYSVTQHRLASREDRTLSRLSYYLNCIKCSEAYPIWLEALLRRTLLYLHEDLLIQDRPGPALMLLEILHADLRAENSAYSLGGTLPGSANGRGRNGCLHFSYALAVRLQVEEDHGTRLAALAGDVLLEVRRHLVNTRVPAAALCSTCDRGLEELIDCALRRHRRTVSAARPEPA